MELECLILFDQIKINPWLLKNILSTHYLNLKYIIPLLTIKIEKNPVFLGKGPPEGKKLKNFKILKHGQWWLKRKPLKSYSK